MLLGIRIRSEGLAQADNELGGCLFHAYHVIMHCARAIYNSGRIPELVDDNAVAAPWNDDWRQELHSFLSW